MLMDVSEISYAHIWKHVFTQHNVYISHSSFHGIWNSNFYLYYFKQQQKEKNSKKEKKLWKE